LVIRGGENLYPREIEEVLIHHPNVEGKSWYFVPKIVLIYCEKIDPDLFLKIEAEGREFLGLGQRKASTIFETECFFNLFVFIIKMLKV
jgi:acyl-CoA synthetase (AMP-forming)/AMP-acid ligase II